MHVPINIIIDELRSQSRIFDMFILDRIDRELHSLKSLELKLGSSLDFSEFVTNHLLKSFLMCSFACLGLLERLLMPCNFIPSFKLRRHLSTETYGRLPLSNCEIIN